MDAHRRYAQCGLPVRTRPSDTIGGKQELNSARRNFVSRRKSNSAFLAYWPVSKWIFLLACALVAASAPMAAIAEDSQESTQEITSPPEAEPALWIVQDNDTSIYIFGTLHVLTADTVWLREPVRTLFLTSDQLVIETIVPTDNLASVMQPYLVNPPGEDLRTILSETQFTELEELVEPTGLGVDLVNLFRPIYAASLVTGRTIERLQISGSWGVESVLLHIARASGMQIEGLESFETQMGYLLQVPMETQIQMLFDVLRRREAAPAAMQALMDGWSAGDVDSVVSILDQEMASYPAFREIMIAGRNRNWAIWIEDRLQRPGQVFLAVGVGHLGGADNLQAVLAQRGIRAERIIYQASDSRGSN